MVDTASSTLMATINQALLLEQGITIVGEPFEQDGQMMVGVRNDLTQSSYAVALSELPKLSQSAFNTPGVFRATSNVSSEDDSLAVCSTDQHIAIKHLAACGVDEQSDECQEGRIAVRWGLIHDPQAVAEAVNEAEQELPAETVQTVKQEVRAALNDVGSQGEAGRASVTQFAQTVSDPDLKRYAVAVAMGTNPPPERNESSRPVAESSSSAISPAANGTTAPPAGQVSTTSILVTTSGDSPGIETSRRIDAGTEAHSVSPGDDSSYDVPIGSLTIPPERLHEIYLAATSPAVSNQEFVKLLPPSTEGTDLGVALSDWSQMGLDEQVSQIRQGIAGLLEDLPEAHRPPRSDGRGPDSEGYRLEFFYHHKTSRGDDSIEIVRHSSEPPHLDPFEESGLLEGGSLSYGRRHTAAGFGVFSFFSKALERSGGDSGSTSVFVPVSPNFFAMTETRRGIFAIPANPRGEHATERATARIEGNPQPSDHEGRDQDGRGEGGRRERDGHHGHEGHDEENPDDPYATWNETSPEEPATPSA